ncbi:hypothetical protein GGTG_04772 [Gaeumannomyces tritici R3-111a-1]|uniref:Tat pathway signal sequence n=1 Tax=Gaeumannomyces tritici (strain R3-111a-1) TaxID=644352 RepID=J3NU21_GAET3|nr:hypothetical protein GGTG_04772 [Gaeumannomyces tritici R3-111a-1]EJT79688.1 hypothetical protein GGTG_04772 [Gaeumannomyces tritici R3-111a-1]
MPDNAYSYIRLRNLRAGVAGDSPHDDNHRPSAKHQARSRVLLIRSKLKSIILAASLVFNCFFLLKILAINSVRDRLVTYSPAQEAIQYERVVFSSAFGIETSPFQGEPSPENDKLWANLYDFAISRISTAEARHMDNKTLPIPNDRGRYIVQLAVFHQLHCLNILRKGIYGAVDMSNTDDLLGIEHMDHCVDILRQSIMCNSDVTPTTFARKSLDSDMKLVAEVVHSCRDFTKIQQWAWNRRLKSELDKTTLVTDDPLGWGTYTYSP